MTNGTGRPRRGTPASHLGDHLALITQFTEQARAGVEQDSETARVFLSVYCGFLIEAGAGIRWLLEPALIEQATVAIRRLAPAGETPRSAGMPSPALRVTPAQMAPTPGDPRAVRAVRAGNHPQDPHRHR